MDDICRRHAIGSATFYAWRKKYGGMEAGGAKRLRALEAERSGHPTPARCLHSYFRPRSLRRQACKHRAAGPVPFTARWSFTARRVREDDVCGLSTDFANALAGDAVLAQAEVLGQHRKVGEIK